MKKIKILLQSYLLSLVFISICVGIFMVTDFIISRLKYMDSFLLPTLIIETLLIIGFSYSASLIKNKICIPLSFIFTSIIGLIYYYYDIKTSTFFPGLTIFVVIPVVLGNSFSWIIYYFFKRHNDIYKTQLATNPYFGD